MPSPVRLSLRMMRLPLNGFQPDFSGRRACSGGGPAPRAFGFPFGCGLCYNLRAVVRPANQREVLAGFSEADAEAPGAQRSPAELAESAHLEDASRFCPVCSQRLESRRCKLICPVCGYYMSCADYY